MSEAVNPTIFRAYDIRGVVDVDLTAATVRLLGQAVGTFFGSSRDRQWWSGATPGSVPPASRRPSSRASATQA